MRSHPRRSKGQQYGGKIPLTATYWYYGQVILKLQKKSFSMQSNKNFQEMLRPINSVTPDGVC